MMEILGSEIWALIMAVAPAIGSVLAAVVSAVLAIRKVGSCVAEFKQSNELKYNNEQIKALLADNKQLKKMNERLLVELTRIKPEGWTDDKNEET